MIDGALADGMQVLSVDWEAMFTPEANVIEIFVRGTVMYFLLVALLRITPRRTVGSLGIVDLVVVVFVAEAAGKALGGEYDSLIDGGILVATLIGWGVVLDWLTYHVPVVERILSPPPMAVVRNGRMLRRNMRSELLTEDELMGKLREQGVEDLSEVRVAYVEEDGALSVLTSKDKSRSRHKAPSREKLG